MKGAAAFIVGAGPFQIKTFVLEHSEDVEVIDLLYYFLRYHSSCSSAAPPLEPPPDYCLLKVSIWRSRAPARWYCACGSVSTLNGSRWSNPDRNASSARRIVSSCSAERSIIEMRPVLSSSQYIVKGI